MKEKILKSAQNQMGTANLEAKGLRGLLKSFFGKLLQWIAMTRFPIGAKNRCRLERLRGAKIGRNVFLGGGNVLDRVRPDLITIEDDVAIAGNVYILTHSNPTAPLREILGPSSHVIEPVRIKKGAWIAVNVVILPGVTIGENSIVSAGSVVAKDVPDHSVVGVLPARFMKEIKISD
jgi:acetyltransferase-like isoleucine patch superfamily enzyme